MKLGTVKIEYDREGKFSSAAFKPAEFVNFDKRLLSQLKQVKCSTHSEEIQYNAEMIFSGWVSGVENLDLTDLMFDKKLVSKIVDCQKFEDDKIKLCEIEFSLEENEKLN